ncbi:MAG: hypothetical protein WBV82_01575 [Myxococcaceae bacterium]
MQTEVLKILEETDDHKFVRVVVCARQCALCLIEDRDDRVPSSLLDQIGEMACEGSDPDVVQRAFLALPILRAVVIDADERGTHRANALEEGLSFGE